MVSDQLYKELSNAINNHKKVALLTITSYADKELVGKKLLLMNDKRYVVDEDYSQELIEVLIEGAYSLLLQNKSKTFSARYQEEEMECFVEVFLPPLKLIVAGAGHVSEPVATIGQMLGFYVTVIDDREDFANQHRFPMADEVVCSSYIEYFRNVPLSPHTYILLLTRGHKFDVVSLQEILKREESIPDESRTKYIGMIGSRRRISGVFEQLKDEFTEHNFKNIFSPVGLDIGAETPEEIAISIFAEILSVKNASSGKPLKEKIPSYSKLKFRERKDR
ncbi:XdhC family protein [Ornithinibacillus halophilus]|uniref:Xanthine dehydrogenase accessory factor n=1 Tax=Ornithinibacillus halophilus TaxID=930117 RepID=A0A1M5FM75_9BACI|nr:XdhC family protein [Ornithinibacillus halophilus]SHF92595.1 xanthine dehydrogenase accessory factor [Ornithinibacillus halophilus]